MDEITYVTGVGGEPYSLDCRKASSGAALGLHSYEWEHELGMHRMRSAASLARTARLDVSASREALDSLMVALASDVDAMEPGTLEVRGWRQRALAPEADAKSAYVGHGHVEVTFALLDGYWWRERMREFFSQTDVTGMDYPHDHGHDYGFSVGRATVDVGGIGGSPVRVTFFGPCESPHVTVGSNTYQVNASVPAGSRLVVDSFGDAPTVTLYNRYGIAEDRFAEAVRDGGLGGGTYAFEPLPQGRHEVTWGESLSLVLEWHERRAVPPWSR